MDMTGEFRIPAPRDAVWRALNDPEVLKQSIPGCETVEKTSDTEFVAKVTAAVGPVKARFGGKVTLSDIDPPNGYTISGEGQGGVAGFAKGGATVEDVELMRAIVGSDVGVKASGGVRTAEDALRMAQAGANRIGASASVAIVTGKTEGDKKGY